MLFLLLGFCLELLLFSQGYSATTFCDSFQSVANGPNIYCAFEVCGAVDVTVSGCSSDGGSCFGISSFSVWRLNGSKVAVSSSSCNGCSKVSFHQSSTNCNWYNLHQTCVSGVCNGTTVVSNGVVSSLASQQFAVLSLPVYVWSYSGFVSAFDGWDISDTTQWTGVTINNDYISSVSLDYIIYQGHLTCDFFANIPKLEYFSIFVGFLTGTLPSCINMCTKLTRLELEYNYLTGTIPLLPSSLEYIHLGTNHFTGLLPAWSPGYAIVDFSSNELTGTIPDLTDLMGANAWLYLGSNRLTGTIATSAPLQFYVFDVSFNSLTGSIPELDLTNWFETFNVCNNQLTHTLPALPVMINHFYVNDNLLSQILPDFPRFMMSFDGSDNSFYGPLPSLSETNWLEELVIQSNFLSHKLPAVLPDLTVFSIGNNWFSGSLPTIPSTLTQLNISRNRFTGTISNSVCFLQDNSDVEARGNLFTCYEACFNLPSVYLDYVAEYTMSDPYTVPAYDMCSNFQTDSLCSVWTELQLSNYLPTEAAFLAESQTVALVPEFDEALNGGSKQFSYSYTDSTSTFSRFSVSFDPRSLAAKKYVIINYFTDVVTTTYEGVFPGVGDILPYSTTFPFVKVLVVIVNYLNVGADSPVLFNVKRYSQYNDWECGSVVTNPCSWYGVECNQNSRITGLSLKGLHIEGSIPTAIGGLRYLESLDLSDNSFTGALPDSLGQLVNLTHMDLSNNALTVLSSNLTLLTNLKSLSLSNNGFGGSLPVFLASMTQLSYLDIKANSFKGKFPAAFCVMENKTSIAAQGNSFSCFEGCFDSTALRSNKVTLDSSVLYCAPTSVPTSSPTHPTPYPTSLSPAVESSSVSTTAIVASVLGAAVLMCAVAVGGYVVILEGKRSVERPLHYRLRKGRRVDEVLILQHADTLDKDDGSGMSVLRLYYSLGKEHLLDESALLTTVRIGMGLMDTALETVESIAKTKAGDEIEQRKPYFWEVESEQREAWWLLIGRHDHKSVYVVRELLQQLTKEQLMCLFTKCDDNGRSSYEMASARVKHEMNRYRYLHGRYEIVPATVHKSATSHVIFAVDHPPVFASESKHASSWRNRFVPSSPLRSPFSKKFKYNANIFPTTESNRYPSVALAASSSKAAVKVALKFMSNPSQFHSEVSIRDSSKFDDNFVIPVIERYDISNTEDSDFFESAKYHGFGDYPYCIVMRQADKSLAQHIEQTHTLSSDPNEIRRLIKLLCDCVAHLHHKDIVHGDLKPSNFVLVEDTVRVIDFDASTSSLPESDQYLGEKYSTAYLPPEMLHEEGMVVKGFKRDNSGKMVDVSEVISPKGVKFMQHKFGYTLLRSSPNIDLWSLGVILFQICAGVPLFQTSLEGNISRSEAALLCEWSSNTVQQKLQAIQERNCRNMISRLLQKIPERRLHAPEVLDHAFMTLHNPERLVGEKAQYDVFLSYRVVSDQGFAEMLFNELSALGLNVWMDVHRLRDGFPWRDGFCQGLLQSACFVCLISRGAINNPNNRRANFTLLKADQVDADNVLVEWRLALELQQRLLIRTVYPIMIGDATVSEDDVKTYSNYYPSGCHPLELPDYSVSSVEDIFIDQLNKNGLGTPMIPNQTVKGTVDGIMANQGGFVRGPENEALHRVCAAIKNMVASADLVLR